MPVAKAQPRRWKPLLRALVLVIYANGPPNPQRYRSCLPDSPTMEHPPLPGAVLPAESNNDLAPTRMTLNILCHVQNDFVDDDPWTRQLENYDSPRRHSVRKQ